jgi:lipid-A-disaccharide synthase
MILSIFVVAGEDSGDILGADALQRLKDQKVDFNVTGVGGRALKEQGLASLFPMSDLSVMGVVAVLARLPLLMRRIRETVAAIVAAQPDLVLLIDAQEFCHSVAKRVRKQAPHIKIVQYVAPSVWAWNSKRAPKMRAYIDHVFALLPFEPEVFAHLQGPPCTYVGHPLLQGIPVCEPRTPSPTSTVLVLPGSRRSEITRLMPVFGDTLRGLPRSTHIALPTLPHREALVRDLAQSWPIKPDISSDPAHKAEAFAVADAALSASGTVTLEVALANIPQVVAYRVSPFEEPLRFLIQSKSVVLPNIVLGENAIPECLQWDASPDILRSHLLALLHDTPERAAQMQALSRLRGCFEDASDLAVLLERLIRSSSKMDA